MESFLQHFSTSKQNVRFCWPNSRTLSFEVLDWEQYNLPSLELKKERKHELWKHSCFELFFKKPGETSYFELNFSPSGAWNFYQFSAYREGLQEVSTKSVPLFHEKGAAHYQLMIELPETWLGRGPLIGQVACVLEQKDHVLEYYALKHGPWLDFHHQESFIPLLCEGK